MKVKVNHFQNYRDLNQGVLHSWSKLVDSSLNRWKVMMQTNSWLKPGNDNTRRLKLALGKNIVG